MASIPARRRCALASLRPIRPDPADGAVRLPADAPGQVVSVPDPDTGAELLIGTQLNPGQAVAVARNAPEFSLPTWQGVVVEPLSDRLTLRATRTGFVMAMGTGGAGALAATTADLKAVASAGGFSRRYEFPALPNEGLNKRVQAAVDVAAAAPDEGRTAHPRWPQAMIAVSVCRTSVIAGRGERWRARQQPRRDRASPPSPSACSRRFDEERRRH